MAGIAASTSVWCGRIFYNGCHTCLRVRQSQLQNRVEVGTVCRESWFHSGKTEKDLRMSVGQLGVADVPH